MIYQASASWSWCISFSFFSSSFCRAFLTAKAVLHFCWVSSLMDDSASTSILSKSCCSFLSSQSFRISCHLSIMQLMCVDLSTAHARISGGKCFQVWTLLTTASVNSPPAVSSSRVSSAMANCCSKPTSCGTKPPSVGTTGCGSPCSPSGARNSSSAWLWSDAWLPLGDKRLLTELRKRPMALSLVSEFLDTGPLRSSSRSPSRRCFSNRSRSMSSCTKLLSMIAKNMLMSM
mmetsp:Transcript_45983/g.104440  ORF Transcript_45983/g.104440 Transcript_45983/m.104440 type:complete len:232 (+) Transcript_45983:317-1012(+)